MKRDVYTMKLYIREIGTEDIKGTVTVSNDYLTALISNLKKKMSKYALGFFPNIVDNGINISIYEAGEECCNITIPKTVLIGNVDKDTDKIFNDYLMKDGYVGLYINRHNSEYESLKDKTTKSLKKENLHMIRKLHIKESADNVETWDVYYWDKEDMEHYNNKVVHMTSNEVKKYVNSLNADMDDYDRERGWWDYELS